MDIIKMLSDTAIKTAPNKIEGYLVKFNPGGEVDLYGEYFTKDTNFGDAEAVPIFFDHGFDKWIGREQIGTGKLIKKDEGIWIEGELTIKTPEKFKKDALERRKQYLEAIGELAEKKSLGWSSGAVGHLVVREDGIGGTYLKQWIIGEASLTPTPAEPSNDAFAKAIKNLFLSEMWKEPEIKVGAKISKSRYEKIKQAAELMNSIIAEIEPEDDPIENSDILNKHIILSKLNERLKA